MPKHSPRKFESNWQTQLWIVVAIVLALWILGIAGTAIQRLLVGSLQVPRAVASCDSHVGFATPRATESGT